MARLRHGRSGVVVSVSDASAARLRQSFGYVDADGTDTDEAPVNSANKSAWVAHAVANGADPDEAESMTKAELQEQFG